MTFAARNILTFGAASMCGAQVSLDAEKTYVNNIKDNLDARIDGVADDVEEVADEVLEIIYERDRIIQKKPHPDYITHKPDYTKEFAQYYVTDAHEPLVSKEMWEKAQNIKEEHKRDIYFYSRNKVEKIKEEAIQVRSTSHPLWGKLICGECGEPFQRMTVNSGGVNKHFWNCLGRKKKNGCLNHGMMETVIFEKINEVDLNKIDKILIYKDKSIEIKEKTLPIEIVQFYERARLYNLI